MSRYKDADAMIQELKRQYMFLFGTEEIPSGIGMFIENFPTADVAEVVHGEWVEKEVVDNTDEDFDWKIEQWQSARCSVCGKYHTTPYAYYFDNFNYCPNCGAKMDGEK